MTSHPISTVSMMKAVLAEILARLARRTGVVLVMEGPPAFRGTGVSVVGHTSKAVS